ALATTTVGNTTFTGAVGGPFTSLNVTTNNLTAASIAVTSAVSVTNTGSASNISGAISGGAATFDKFGAGNLALSGINTYTGASTIHAGTLLINGSITSNVTVNTSGTLCGNGTVSGSVCVNAGGHVAPGTSPGTLNTHTVTFTNSTSSFDVQIDGIASFDQLDMNDAAGTVSLSGATLNLSGLFNVVPSTLQSFTILKNDGSLPIGGMFAGLPEGSPVSGLSGGPLYITYQGGDGNDVVLNSQPVINGTGGNDTFVLTGDGTDFSLVINGGAPIAYHNPPNFTINGLGGSDHMTVNYISGDALPTGGLAFNGGLGSDTLSIVSPTAQAAVYSPASTANGDGSNDGSILINGTKPIGFTSLSPIDYSVTGGSFTLNTPAPPSP
ncbi:MAG: autotransporter-associated beta strand repeat-containing protein, partial [Planctomycetia bacterium]|nr:autotransporter-associated beta strand repeat-containing protein [Planctomycetia bacterium]